MLFPLKVGLNSLYMLFVYQVDSVSMIDKANKELVEVA